MSTLKISNWTFTYIYLLVLSLYWSIALLCSLTGKISNTGSLAGRLTGRLAEKFLMRWVTEDHNVPLQKSSIIFIDHLRARQQWFWHEHPAKPPTMFSISLKDLFKNCPFFPPCKIRKFQVQTCGGRGCVKFLPPGIPGVRGQTCFLNKYYWYMVNVHQRLFSANQPIIHLAPQIEEKNMHPLNKFYYTFDNTLPTHIRHRSAVLLICHNTWHKRLDSSTKAGWCEMKLKAIIIIACNDASPSDYCSSH